MVDFIDMRSSKAERKIEKELRDAMKADKARQTSTHQPQRLLEINRQRIQQTLAARTQELCPACAGTGRVMSKDSLGLTLLRKIESRAAAVAIERVKITLNPDFAETFRGGRKREIQALERDFGLKIEINGARRLRVTEHEFEWFDRPAGEAVVTEQRKWGGLAPAAAQEADAPARRGQPSSSPREREKPKAGEAGEGKKRGRRRRGGRGRNKKKLAAPEAGSAAPSGSTEVPPASQERAAPAPAEDSI